jgi:hypothetical protein
MKRVCKTNGAPGNRRAVFFSGTAQAEPNPLNALHAKNACWRQRNKLRSMNAGETRLAVKTFTTPA